MLSAGAALNFFLFAMRLEFNYKKNKTKQQKKTFLEAKQYDTKQPMAH